MPTQPIKITHAPTNTTRKLNLESTSSVAELLNLVLIRFSLREPAELVYKDEDGDLITLVRSTRSPVSFRSCC